MAKKHPNDNPEYAEIIGLIVQKEKTAEKDEDRYTVSELIQELYPNIVSSDKSIKESEEEYKRLYPLIYKKLKHLEKENVIKRKRLPNQGKQGVSTRIFLHDGKYEWCLYILNPEDFRQFTIREIYNSFEIAWTVYDHYDYTVGSEKPFFDESICEQHIEPEGFKRDFVDYLFFRALIALNMNSEEEVLKWKAFEIETEEQKEEYEMEKISRQPFCEKCEIIYDTLNEYNYHKKRCKG